MSAKELGARGLKPEKIEEKDCDVIPKEVLEHGTRAMGLSTCILSWLSS